MLRDDWTLHVHNCVERCRLSPWHALNVSSPGMMSFHETVVHANLRCLRRAVIDSKAQLSAERKLRLCGKFVNMRHPSFLRKADGSRVEDQSLWNGIVSEHFKKKLHCSDAVCPDAIREPWRLRVNGALRHGHSPGELSYC